MNGPEHYAEAERLLAESDIPPSERAKPRWMTADELVAAAQVHATLALAAATAYPAVRDYLGDEGRDSYDWMQATRRAAVSA